MAAAKTPTRRSTASSQPARRGDDRRRAQKVRGRVLLGGAVALSALLLVSWFPFSTLLAQHRAIASASEQLADLRSQDRALAAEQAKLSSPSEIQKLAREQYQLVQPGQRLVQVLPSSGSPSASSGSSPYPGDPGLAPVVRPSAVALLPGGAPSAAPHSSTSATKVKSAPAATSPGLVSRIASSLEFWKR